MEDSEAVQALAQFTGSDRMRHVQLHLDMTHQVLYHEVGRENCSSRLINFLPIVYFPQVSFNPYSEGGE